MQPRSSLVVALAAAALFPAVARAQLVAGARAGVGFAVGDVGGTLAMRDWVAAQAPLQLDVLYRVRPQLALGGYASYGFARVGGDLDDVCDSRCSASVVRLGVQAEYAFDPRGRWRPWGGAGLGYEWNRVEGFAAEGNTDPTVRGIEYLNLQGGAELEVSAGLAVGPYLSLSVGEYGSVDTSAVQGGERSIIDKRMHAWLGLGVRGTFRR